MGVCKVYLAVPPHTLKSGLCRDLHFYRILTLNYRVKFSVRFFRVSVSFYSKLLFRVQVSPKCSFVLCQVCSGESAFSSHLWSSLLLMSFSGHAGFCFCEAFRRTGRNWCIDNVFSAPFRELNCVVRSISVENNWHENEIYSWKIYVIYKITFYHPLTPLLFWTYWCPVHENLHIRTLIQRRTLKLSNTSFAKRLERNTWNRIRAVPSPWKRWHC